MRKAALDAYGGVCQCCGLADQRFLTIDHINNDGAAHRRQIGASALYLWLRDNEYPLGFQTMCWNCNMAKARFGGVCPHQADALTIGAGTSQIL